MMRFMAMGKQADFDWAYDFYKLIKKARESGETDFLGHPLRGEKYSRCGAPNTFLEVIYPINRTEMQVELYECLNPECRHATTVRPNLDEEEA
jgi:hypothetical protein